MAQLKHPNSKKADVISLSAFFLLSAIFLLSNLSFAWLVLSLGISSAIKNCIIEKPYVAFQQLALFLVVFLTMIFQVSWKYIIGVFFLFSATNIILRELGITKKKKKEKKSNSEVEITIETQSD